MRWASALSTRPSLEAAVAEVVEQAQRSLQATPDLGFVFISSAFASEYPRLMPLLKERLWVPALIGCSGGGVIGTNGKGETEEVEEEAALSLTLAHLPGVKVNAFHLDSQALPDLDGPPDAWTQLIGISPEENPQFVLLGDPMSSGINELLQGLDFAYPGSPKVGGLAGMGASVHHSGLFGDYTYYRQGVVGVSMSGNVVMETIVAQGCRPIGQPYRVVEGDRNVLIRVEEQSDENLSSARGAISPLEALQDLLQTLNEADRQLAQRSLFIGVAQNEFKQWLEPGDFLIRNVLGADPRVGAIAIGDRVRPGQRVQFHLRDATASAQDLETLLEQYQQQMSAATAPKGALMFACMGRGEGLYNQSSFDSQLFHRYIENIPLSGFFCNGEIGPVGGTTFLHGYTSVFGICRQP
jgi:small ligand-binding sensory domain FIST